MCSSILISLLAGGSHLTALMLANKFRPPEYQSYLLFTKFYLIMEVFQASQWYWLDFTETSCSALNTGSTVFAYLLIWWQPYLFVQMGEKIGLQLNYARNLSLFTLIYALILLLVGLNRTPTYELPNSNFAKATYTDIGSHGHLAWYFSPLSIVYGPTFYVYFAMILTLIWYYPRNLKYTVGLGWSITLVLSFISVGTSADLPAFWCLLSFLVDIPIVIRCITYKQ